VVEYGAMSGAMADRMTKKMINPRPTAADGRSRSRLVSRRAP
jgi:hypothetical protein